MRRSLVLALMTVVLLIALAAPTWAGGICIPSNDPYHKPPLCVT